MTPATERRMPPTVRLLKEREARGLASSRDTMAVDHSMVLRLIFMDNPEVVDKAIDQLFARGMNAA